MSGEGWMSTDKVETQILFKEKCALPGRGDLQQGQLAVTPEHPFSPCQGAQRVTPTQPPGNLLLTLRQERTACRGDCASRTHLPVPPTRARAEPHLSLLFEHECISHSQGHQQGQWVT